MTKSKKIKQW